MWICWPQPSESVYVDMGKHREPMMENFKFQISMKERTEVCLKCCVFFVFFVRCGYADHYQASRYMLIWVNTGSLWWRISNFKFQWKKELKCVWSVVFFFFCFFLPITIGEEVKRGPMAYMPSWNWGINLKLLLSYLLSYLIIWTRGNHRCWRVHFRSLINSGPSIHVAHLCIRIHVYQFITDVRRNFAAGDMAT